MTIIHHEADIYPWVISEDKGESGEILFIPTNPDTGEKGTAFLNYESAHHAARAHLEATCLDENG